MLAPIMKNVALTLFAKNHWKAHREANTAGYDWTAPDNLERSAGMTGLLRTIFGLEWATLNGQQKERLEDAYDKSMSGHNNHTADANRLLYGGHEPIIVTITRILNEHTGIVWTSYVHTGAPVPVFAIGPDAKRFAGLSGNTSIAKQMARAMGIRQPLPVKKQAATSR